MIIIRINPYHHFHHYFHHLLFHFHSRYEAESSVEIYKIDTVSVEKNTDYICYTSKFCQTRVLFQVAVSRQHSTTMIRGGGGGASPEMQLIMLTTILGHTK